MITIALKIKPNCIQLKGIYLQYEDRKIRRKRWEKIVYEYPIQIKGGIALVSDKMYTVAKKRFKEKSFLIIERLF